MTDGFTLPPLAEALIAGDELSDWMLGADRGDVLVIARGRVRPTHAPVWFAATMAERAGKARIVTTPAPGAAAVQIWSVEWLASRDGAAAERASLRAASDGRVRAEPVTGDGEPVTDAMLRRIRRAANLGEGAPSLRELARVSEMKSPQAAKYWLTELAKRGMLRIDDRNCTIAGAERRFALRGSDGEFAQKTGWSARQPPPRRG